MSGARHNHHAGGHHLGGAFPPLPQMGAPFGRPGVGGGVIDVLGLLPPRGAHNHHTVPPAIGLASSQGMSGPMSTVAGATTAAATTTASSSPPSLQMQHFMAQDFGLLQDMLPPPFVHSNGGNIQP